MVKIILFFPSLTKNNSINFQKKKGNVEIGKQDIGNVVVINKAIIIIVIIILTVNLIKYLSHEEVFNFILMKHCFSYMSRISGAFIFCLLKK